jgi:hypothetical protein
MTTQEVRNKTGSLIKFLDAEKTKLSCIDQGSIGYKRKGQYARYRLGVTKSWPQKIQYASIMVQLVTTHKGIHLYSNRKIL